MRAAVRVLMLLETAIFLMAAFLHSGTAIPLGFATLQEPRIVPAMIVETSCGLFIAFAACSLLTGRYWPWAVALASQLFAICGVLLGIVALALGRGPRTLSNDIYHRIMLAMLIAGVLLLILTRRRVVPPRPMPGPRERRALPSGRLAMSCTLEAARLSIGDVDVLVVFNGAHPGERQHLYAGLQQTTPNGNVVLVWRDSQGRTQFLAPAQQHRFFRLLTYEQLHAQANCTIKWPPD